MLSKIQISLIQANIKNMFLAGDDTLSKLFKSYLEEYAVYNFIKRMIEGSKHCSIVMKNVLLKNLWWIKKMMKILKTLLNVGFVG